MFRPHRISSQRNPNTGLIEWFFSTREGLFGPYPSKEQALFSLNDFVQARANAGEDGGRSKETKESQGLSLEPIEQSQVHDPLQKRRDREQR